MPFVSSKLNLLLMLQKYKDFLADDFAVHLYKTAVTPTADSVAADFTEADYSGYSAVVITGYAAVAWYSQGAAVAWPTTPAVFQPTSSLITNTIYGFWLAFTGTPATFMGAELFDTPRPMASTSDQIIIAPPLNAADGLIPSQVY